MQLGGVSVGVRVSVGVTVQTAEHATADELVRDCDIAMYQAKAGGKGRVSVLDQGARSQARDKLRLVADLRAAIDGGGLTVAYQPVVETATMRPVGVEALARWQHPQRGWIAPDVFVPLAEETGLVGALGAGRARAGLRAGRRLGRRAGPRRTAGGARQRVRAAADEHLPALVADTVTRHGVASSGSAWS